MSTFRSACWLLASVVGVTIPAAAQQPTPATGQTSCTICHSDPDLFDEEDRTMVTHTAGGVHAEVGLSCHDCHGGNPDPVLADDLDAAMDEGFAPNPYRGTPTRLEIPTACGSCHSDPDTMRRFRPDIRLDQEQAYWTSHHGRALREGDTKVATCVDCHGVHGILRSDDPAAPIYPTNVAETCERCHGDPEHMAGYTLASGEPLPVDQFARWRQSVHAAALFDKEDLSAPTCNDCHGNHGAAPPGVDSVSFVCGHCHGREAELFRASPKRPGYEEHNELIADMEASSCGDCHESPEAQAAVTGVHSFSECTTCHGNHAVVRPTVAMLSPLPEVPCAFCHEGTGPLAGGSLESRGVKQHYEEARDSLLRAAEGLGLVGDARFDWLVDQAAQLPFHTAASEVPGEPARQRPEFERLFQKFRIGKTHFTYLDPRTGEEVKDGVVRCSHCHGPETILGDAPLGHELAGELLDRTVELTSLTAQAERTLLRARRGGVETQAALLHIDRAIDSQIELEVLIHSFSVAEDGPLVKKHQEGIEHARLAIEEGQKALGEIAFRRRGLVVSLFIIGALLVGLALKIRDLES